MQNPTEPTMAVLETQDIPLKVKAVGTRYVLKQIVAHNPDKRIIMIAGQEVGDNWDWWEVIDKGEATTYPIEVGDIIIVGSHRSGVSLAITGTPYKIVNEVEVIGVLTERAKQWDDHVKDNVEKNIADARAKGKNGGKVVTMH